MHRPNAFRARARRDMTAPIGRAVISENYQPFLHTVCLRSRFCVAGGPPETPRLNDFTELGLSN